MSTYLCLSVTFLDPRFHGRGDRGEPEWPPSPLRLFQALLAANAAYLDNGMAEALRWLECQPAPTIIAPAPDRTASYSLSVPNNAMDLVARAWTRGQYFGAGDANPATHRTMKTVRATRMLDHDTLCYVWPFSSDDSQAKEVVAVLCRATDHLVALGWGVDQVVGRGRVLDSAALETLPGERWKPTSAAAAAHLRTPTHGSLAALQRRHQAFLKRIGKEGFRPVEPLTLFDTTGYRRPADPVSRPHVIFELRNDDGSFYAYSQRKLIHIAGMVRHLAIDAMKNSPPADVEESWVETYVRGYAGESGHVAPHRRFSYLPVPSIGHEHADQQIRRVMVTAPLGAGHWLEHLAGRLQGRCLEPKPTSSVDIGAAGPPTLVRVRHDKMVDHGYIRAANRWASVTPVILPGHDDHKPDKTRKLIEVALAQAGVELPCSYEWGSRSPFFRRSLSAHKYDRRGQPTGYFRPEYLSTQTAVHLTLTFNDDAEPSGPLAIGAGRHCGLGLMARVDR